MVFDAFSTKLQAILAGDTDIERCVVRMMKRASNFSSLAILLAIAACAPSLAARDQLASGHAGVLSHVPRHRPPPLQPSNRTALLRYTESPITCSAGCIPKHIKLKAGRPLCCTEGHETLKCPGPAHYLCGAAPPPTPPSGPGSMIWSFATGSAVQSLPAISSDGKVLYVGSYDNNLYAVDALTGSKIWSFATNSAVDSSPALSSDGKVVYFGSNDGNLYAVAALTGSKIWSFETGGAVSTSPAIGSDGTVVYVGSDDQNLYAVDAVTGVQIWSFSTGGAVESSPTLSGDGKVVYVGTNNNTLYAVATE